MISRLREAVDVDIIESSYIMQIRVRWKSPGTAAKIAARIAKAAPGYQSHV